MLTLAVLGVAGILMLVCFARLAGIAALGEPRCKAVASCVQSNMSLKYPLTILMGLCILSGAGLPFFMEVPGILRQILCLRYCGAGGILTAVRRLLSQKMRPL